MQIVIDIPEELKNKIDNANEDNYKTYLWWFETTLYCAIKNGTPLPKHGRLIDADDIDNHIIGHVDTRYCPTIIDADKGADNG